MKSSVKKIPYVNLKKQWLEERDELLPIIDKVLESAQLVGGDELDKFEKNLFNRMFFCLANLCN